MARQRGLEGRVNFLERELKAAQERISLLEEALAYYTGATMVKSWGNQELEDIGDVARRALGLPEPDSRQLAEQLGVVFYSDEPAEEGD